MGKKTRLTDPIGWMLLNPIPATVGTTYEQIYQLVSNFPVTMSEPLIVTYFGGNDFTVEDQCPNKFLTPGQTCNVTVNFTPTSPGIQQFQLTLHYVEDVVPLLLQTITAEGSTLLVVGSVTQPPATTVVNSIYPVMFSFQNVGTTDATQLLLDKNYPDDFTEEENTCSIGTLAAGATCTINGSFVPKRSGAQTVVISLSYAGASAPISLSTETETLASLITAEVSTPLPDSLEIGNDYPVKFILTNTSPLPATNLAFTKNFPTDFNQTENTCSESLANNASCTLSGILIPNSNTPPGPVTVGLEVAYTEGSSIPLTTTSELVSSVIITGTVVQRLLPTATAFNTPLPVVFKYINQGSAAATGLQVTPHYPAEFTQDADTCTDMLAVTSSCQITGNLDISTPNDYVVGVTLASNETTPESLTTKTTIINAEVIGFLEQGLPPNSVVDSNYSVAFLFTNEGEIEATAVNIVTNYPSDFVENSKTCQTSLVAGANCRVTGTLTPSSEGSQTVEVTFKYAEGDDIVLSASTTVEALALTGIMQQDLSDVTSPSQTYSVIFKYTNNNTTEATGLNITNTNPDNLNITSNTCSGTLAVMSSCTSVIWSPDLSQFLAVGTNGGKATSKNGINYITQVSNVTDTLNACIWNQQLRQYMVVGTNGTILNSSGSIEWQKQNSGVTNTLTDVAWSPNLGRYVVSTNSDYVLNSADGNIWTKPEAKISFIVNAVTWATSLNIYVLIGNLDFISISSNGQEWQTQQSIGTPNINDVIWFPAHKRLYAVGAETYVYYYSITGLKTWRSKPLDVFFRSNLLN